MKKVTLFVLFIMPLFGIAQEHQIGLRLGEPFSITYKTYLDEHFSVEGLIGRGSPNSTPYYRRAFENNRPVSSAVYSGHSVSDAFSLHARVAYNEDISSEFDISEGTLLAYVGVGAQIRSARVDYAYFTPSASDFPVMRAESRNNIDFGPEGYIGSEYIFQDLPLSVFAEVGLFLELVDRPGHIKLQGGIGARYLF
ncbi:hypothetical protein [Lunatibacter salilacus]|uniref:hypothetical protein n=1 Tax=Lunatibacter salilacus TaxID=2483804 RepID=UPI00131E3050|nr:hypothetical protein [Lunatibacter salilacus]